MNIVLRDDFAAHRPRGKALGSAHGDDPARIGRDVERIMSVDGGALRIQPALREGWQRTCLSYGPFPNKPGLTFSILLLNGHNTSQSEVMEDTLRVRLARWAKGSGTVPIGRRLWRWLGSGRVCRTLRQVRWWRRMAAGSQRVTLMDENMAVGFYPDSACDPTEEGAGFVMHADGPQNGELWTGANGCWAPAVLGVQNIPIQYFLTVRQNDIVLAVSSYAGSHGMGSHPATRPVAIVPRPKSPELYAALHQSLLGQIGFRADTRVYGVRVGHLDPDLFATAVDSVWIPEVNTNPSAPSNEIGLIRLSMDPENLRSDGVKLYWRTGEDSSRWELTIGRKGAQLTKREAEQTIALASQEWEQAPTEVQVLDSGTEITILGDSRLLFSQRFEADPLGIVGGFGVVESASDSEPVVISCEGLPRQDRKSVV